MTPDIDSASRSKPADSETQAQGIPLHDVYSAFVRGTRQRPRSKMIEKMMSEGLSFSWCAFLVGPLYLLYRKQYMLGWGYLAICVIANFLTGSINTSESTLSMADIAWSLISLVLDIVIGCAFYPLYSRSARKAYENCRTGHEKNWEVQQGIEREGGTSWAQPIIAFAIVLVILAVFTM